VSSTLGLLEPRRCVQKWSRNVRTNILCCVKPQNSANPTCAAANDWIDAHQVELPVCNMSHEPKNSWLENRSIAHSNALFGIRGVALNVTYWLRGRDVKEGVPTYVEYLFWHPLLQEKKAWKQAVNPASGIQSAFKQCSLLKYLITWDMRSVHNVEFLHLYPRYLLLS